VKIIYGIAKALHYLGAVGLLVLMGLQVANMFGGYFFHSPVRGTTDLGSYMLLVITALALGWAALERRHIMVGLVMDLLPARFQLVVDTVVLTIVTAVAGYVSYLSILAGVTWPPRTSSVLDIPYGPFRIVFGVGFGILAICTLATLIENFRKLGGKKRGSHES